ncbi:exodeoxyribonuclease VII large subunit [uncultured Peptoniphilus sp.]|uniref:exodeoxyribonuclease VII large subunit n=1 Tax=uncultured Peptoniphilus sp. TaxID=254354 RepID=UPI002804CB38|nr:exodeoxyribonuclease VII large subunit [uncultured Peptoniphilus sp.]
MKAIRVSQLNSYIKKIISMDYLLSNVTVEGEISNFKSHQNGNFYFSLKDESSRINAIVFYKEAENLSFKLEDGLKIVAKGNVSYYEKDGQTNFYISEIISSASGNLYEKFLKLREKLDKEGLFDQDHKKAIPYFPRTIGIITSSSGAAVKDMVNMLRLRNSLVDIIIYPSLVQGPEAPSDLISGIEYFNRERSCDLIILGRGGGSFEDLFAFNDEKLARAIYASNIPIISAVGHEVDFSISDFVSDKRAATPTKAAEIATVSKVDLEKNLRDLFIRLNLFMDRGLEDREKNLRSFRAYINFFTPANKILGEKKNLKDLSYRGEVLIARIINVNRHKINILGEKLRGKIRDISYKKTVLYGIKTKLEYLMTNDFYLRHKDLKYYLKYLNYNIRKNYLSYKSIQNILGRRLKSYNPNLSLNIRAREVETFKDNLVKKDFFKKLYEERENLSRLKKIGDKDFINSLKDIRGNLQMLNYKLKDLFQNINKIDIRLQNGEILKDISQILPGDNIDLIFKNAIAKANIKEIEEKSYE